MSMLFGSALSFGSFVFVVVFAQVSTLRIFRFALRLGFRFMVYLNPKVEGLGLRFETLGL